MLVSIFGLAALAVALPSKRYVEHETRQGWQKISHVGQRVPADAIIPVRIALTQSNLEHGDTYLLDTSLPSSVNYGRHWTAEQVRDKFAPSPDTVEKVSSWLYASGVREGDLHQSENKVWLAANLPASHVESLFQTEFYLVEVDDGTARVGCDNYFVPHDLVEHIDYVKPGVSASPVVARKRQQARSQSNAEIASRLNAAAEKRRRSLSRRGPRGAAYNFTGETDVTQNLALLAANLAADNNDTASDNLAIFAALVSNETATCDSIITPACIRGLYNIPLSSNSTTPSSCDALGLIEEQDEVFSQADFDFFTEAVAPEVPVGTQPNFYLIDNTTTAVGDVGGGESMLDYDMIYPLIYPQVVQTYQITALDEQSDYLGSSSNENALLEAVDGSYCTQADIAAGADCGTVNLTRVLSISYGGQELEVSEKRARAACAEVMKLSLQGHTIVEASGDYGVAGNTQTCVDSSNVTASAAGDTSFNGTVFNTDLWSSCPYILSVGGSQVDPGFTVTDPEVSMGGTDDTPVASRFGSTGGFSNYEPLPSYQADAVNAYFASYDPGYPTYDYQSGQAIGANGGLYNRPGRGFPDISANGNNIFTVANLTASASGGTSAAAPIVASIITLINQERTAVGKGPVGFVNPVLYQHPEAFNDITDGNNPGCNTGGFKAVPGWDPVTGLGTPDYEKLLQIFLSLP